MWFLFVIAYHCLIYVLILIWCYIIFYYLILMNMVLYHVMKSLYNFFGSKQIIIFTLAVHYPPCPDITVMIDWAFKINYLSILSGRHFHYHICKMNSFKNYFIPVAVRLLNNI